MTALACFYLQIPVGHVEAGLRTYNIYSPFPEEFNREAVGIIAKYNFAPTQVAANNLIREGKDPAKIYITGNTVIDAMKHTVKEDYNIQNSIGWQMANLFLSRLTGGRILESPCIICSVPYGVCSMSIRNARQCIPFI